ncbi:MAG: hypothetical protein KDC95_24060 [Planctomycetes bacterium]|nr:hypothetical protein [Planctomycetota bacterium]
MSWSETPPSRLCGFAPHCENKAREHGDFCASCDAKLGRGLRRRLINPKKRVKAYREAILALKSALARDVVHEIASREE